MTNSFQCPWCHAKLKVDDSLTGQGILCPTCNARVQMPSIDDADKPFDEMPSAAGAVNTIRFQCPKCGKRLKSPKNQAGKQGKCSRCGAVVCIPDEPSFEELPSLEVNPAPTAPAAR